MARESITTPRRSGRNAASKSYAETSSPEPQPQPRSAKPKAKKATGAKAPKKPQKSEKHFEKKVVKSSPGRLDAAEADTDNRQSRKRTAEDSRLDDESTSTSTAKRIKTDEATNGTTSSHTSQEVFWLMKAEPDSRIENGVDVKFSIDDLAACTEPEPWSGVRNPVARNNMKEMKKGDLAFFYHSNAKPSGIVGIMKVVGEATVDESAFNPKDPYYDAKSKRETPKWFNVHVEFEKKFPRIIDLKTLKSLAEPGKPLENMQLVKQSRLSVNRVTKEQWDFINELAENDQADGQA